MLNPASAVATVTQVTCDLTTAEVTAYAQVAEQFLGQEIVYLEYSGTLGDPDLIAAVREALSSVTLFYGGGIHEYDLAPVADTGHDQPSGQQIKTEPEDARNEEINHGRLYPNLDTLVNTDYVEKGEIDRRTNYYELTDEGRTALRERREWEAQYLRETALA